MASSKIHSCGLLVITRLYSITKEIEWQSPVLPGLGQVELIVSLWPLQRHMCIV